jgi:hypothetical protein
MEPAVLVALITIAIPAIAAPIIAAVVSSRSKKAEWARADLLEQRQVERAALVAQRAEETSRLLIASSTSMRDIALTIDGKVDEVHALVNSSYTAALQAALEAVQAKLVVLLDSSAFKKEHSMEVSAGMIADITATQTKMDELSTAIQERLKQDAAAKETKAKAILVGAQSAKE